MEIRPSYPVPLVHQHGPLSFKRWKSTAVYLEVTEKSLCMMQLYGVRSFYICQGPASVSCNVPPISHAQRGRHLSDSGIRPCRAGG